MDHRPDVSLLAGTELVETLKKDSFKNVMSE